jgi:hypothetical protein
MMRDYSPIERCKECGQVTRMLIFEIGLDENGDASRAIRGESVPHDRTACESMKALEKETWPTLW